MDQVSSPVSKDNRRYRSLRPIAPEDSIVFQSVLQGEFLIRSFRNKDIRFLLFPEPKSFEQQRHDMARTSRLISLLRAHGLIKKIPTTRLYRITNKGHRIMSTALVFRNTNIAILQECV